jgi:HD-GYP domain-containing protein (c-di-GMP phosphodiesterase class II)
MSSDRQSASPSSGADDPPADRGLAELVRLRGAPLLEALEAHSPGSRDHAEATGAHTFAAAVEIGLDRAVAELCRETAKLHDVGMVYVPASVVQTPFESWGAAEREVFEAHYEAGARLALGAGIPDDVCDWLLRIRERFDGLGPEGLAGDAIAVPARLARAACAWDTLAPAASGETLDERRGDAITRLRGAAGRELDPQIVDALVTAVARPGAG